MELTEHAASQPLISSHPHNSSRQSSRSFGLGCRINDRQAAIIAAVYTIVSVVSGSRIHSTIDSYKLNHFTVSKSITASSKCSGVSV